MKIGNREFDLQNHTYVMGILNVTPDSFSDGGRFQQLDQALFHVQEMLDQGMDILDIGGESTRPGYQPLPEQEEMERVLPVMEEVKKRFLVPISLDTCKGEVARAGILAGADLINDIWGLKHDETMAQVLGEAQVPCVLMHNRKEAVYESLMEEVLSDLKESIAIAHQAGITDDKIILDPGIGFGKTWEQNLEMIGRVDQLKTLGYPLLLGTSRKSVIGLTLNLPVNERLEGTLVTTVYGVMKGCGIVRVHDVKENVRAIKMAEAIRKAAGEVPNGFY